MDLRAQQMIIQSFEAMPTGILLLDDAENMVYANPAALAILGSGFLAEPSGGKGPLGNFAFKTGTRQRVSAGQLPARQVLDRKADHAALDVEIERPDGRRVLVELLATALFRAEGSLEGVLLQVRDVTEARQTQEERRHGEERAHLLTAAGAVLASSLDFEVTLKNIAKILVPEYADWCSISFLQPDGSLQNLVFRHVDQERNLAVRDLHPHYPAVEEPSGEARVVHRGNPIFEPIVSEESLRARSVSPHHLERLRWIGMHSVIAVPIVTRGQEILGVMKLVCTELSGRTYSQQDLVTAQTLSEMASSAIENALSYRASQRAVEERRRAQEQQKEQAEKLKNTFISRISHELRTPLTSIKGSLALLAAGALGPLEAEKLDLVEIAHRNTVRVIDLVNEILDIERVANGSIALDMSACEVGVLFQAAREAVAGWADERGVRLEVSSGGQVVPADFRRMTQVLVNLLGNAVKFSRAGGSVRLVSGGVRDWIEFRVSDEGPGIAADEQELIFEPFYQGGGTLTTQPGTGLGLAIAKTIVLQHGGQIGVESQPGQGSTFWVRLPRSYPADKPRAGQSVETPAPIPNPSVS